SDVCSSDLFEVHLVPSQGVQLAVAHPSVEGHCNVGIPFPVVLLRLVQQGLGLWFGKHALDLVAGPELHIRRWVAVDNSQLQRVLKNATNELQHILLMARGFVSNTRLNQRPNLLGGNRVNWAISPCIEGMCASSDLLRRNWAYIS